MTLEILSKEWAPLIVEWLSIRNICRKCGVVYYEIDNIGFWRCSQHPGFVQGDKWSCCGRPILARYISNGCVPADHNLYVTGPYSIKNHIEVPMAIIKQYFDVEKLKGIVLDEFQNRINNQNYKITIARYDFKSLYNNEKIIINTF